MVPTADGRFDGMFALNDGFLNDGWEPVGPFFGAKNVQWNRQAWEYVATGPITASMAVGSNYAPSLSPPPPTGFMYGADGNGILYAFSNIAYSGSGIAPGGSTTVANNPGSTTTARDFTNTEIRFVTAAVYQKALKGTLQIQRPANWADHGPPVRRWRTAVHSCLQLPIHGNGHRGGGPSSGSAAV